MAPCKLWCRKAVMLASCASWLFVSSCAPTLQSGDQRRSSGIYGLTASEAQRAEAAAQIFSSGQLRRVGSVSDDVSVSSAAEQRLRTVAARYRGRDNLSPAEDAELLAAARPVVAPLAVQEARLQGEAAYIIPARSIRTFTFPAYCLDRHDPAPRAGEPLQLVSAETLFPLDLLPLYRGLLRNASQGQGRDNLTQGLVWNLRQFASGTDKAPIVLSPAQEQAVAAADPNGPETFAKYAQQGLFEKYAGDIFNEAVRQGGSRLGLGNVPPAFRQLVKVSNAQALQNVEQSMRSILSQPSFDSSIGGNQGYTLLAPDLAAYATSVGRLQSVHVEVANAADGQAVFQPGYCVGDSGQKKQRVGMQVNALPLLNPLLRASTDFLPWDGKAPQLSPAVFWTGQSANRSSSSRAPFTLIQGPALVYEIPAAIRLIALLGSAYAITQKEAGKLVSSIAVSCRNVLNSDSGQGSSAPSTPPRVSPSGQVSSPVGPPDGPDRPDVPQVVKTRINVSQDGLDHIEDHFSGKDNASQFSISREELRSILNSSDVVDSEPTAIRTGSESRYDDTYQRVVDVGRTIGNDAVTRGGGGQTNITVLTDGFGNLKTAFPGIGVK